MSTVDEDAGPAPASPWSATTTREPVEVVTGKPVSARRRFARRFRRQPAAVVAATVLVLLGIVALLGPVLTPYDPNAQDLALVLTPPSPQHWLGMDELGRDVFSRLVVGAAVSFQAAIQATAISLAIGVPLGLVSGYFGRGVDRTVMLVNDSVMALPALILAIAIVGILGPGLTNAMLAVGIVFAPRVIRLVRATVLEVREETYIEASLAIGTSTTRILGRHVLPNVLSPLIVAASLMAGRSMLAEASLSFLGLGVQPPEASWGAMLGRAFRFTSQAPFLIVYPGIAIAVTVLAFNVLGDGIRDSLGREVRRA